MWLKSRLWPALFVLITALFTHCVSAETAPPAISQAALATQLQVGDLVFIRVAALPFRKVSETTGSWTNHVGIVVTTDGAEPIIAESTFPLSKRGGLARFLGRSEGGRVEISRLNSPLSAVQQKTLALAAQKRMGILYDTGFDLHSSRQFCSRFVHEVVQEATGIEVGQVETFSSMLARNPNTELGFWRLWYFGSIPWQRETVTPASVLSSPQVHPVFDGYVITGKAP